MPLVRMIFPVAVTLKRFFAPLCVLSLCLAGLVGLLTALCPFLLVLALLGLDRVHEHGHGAPLHAGGLLDDPMRAQLVGQLVEQAAADVRVGHLPTAEEDGELGRASCRERV